MSPSDLSVLGLTFTVVEHSFDILDNLSRRFLYKFSKSISVSQEVLYNI